MWENTDVIPSEVPITVRGSGPPSNTLFFGLTRVYIQNGISIGLAVFAVVTDRLTDRPRYFICSNRLHLTSAAVQPDNNSNNVCISIVP